MTNLLDIFHPRHSGSPLAFSAKDKAIVVPSQPKPILLVDKNVRVNLTQLKDQPTIANSLSLNSLLTNNKKHPLSGENVLALLDPRNIALRSRNNEHGYAVAIHRRIQDGTIIAYYWPYLLPLVLRPNPRAGWGAINNRPASKPLTIDELDAKASAMARARKNVEISHKAPAPEMPASYRNPPATTSIPSVKAKPRYEYAPLTLANPGEPYLKYGASTLVTMKYGDGLVPDDLFSIFPVESVNDVIKERMARYQRRKQLIQRTQGAPGTEAAAKRLDFNNDNILRAEAAEYVYEVDEYNRGVSDVMPEAPVGLKPLNPEDISGLENAVFMDEKSGFGAGLFHSEINDETMLVYRGTNNAVTGKEDWLTNGTQGLGKESDQYNQAMDLAKITKESIGSEFSSVGHSLGGGLASSGVAVTGVEGYTFNSAGLHPKTATRVGGIPNEEVSKLIKTQAVEGEVLTMVQQKGNAAAKGATTTVGTLLGGAAGGLVGYVVGDKLPKIPQALGEMQRLPSIQGGSPIDRHGMNQVIDGIESQKQDDIHTLNMRHIDYHGLPYFDH